jgi:hypothetical protein
MFAQITIVVVSMQMLLRAPQNRIRPFYKVVIFPNPGVGYWLVPESTSN